MSSPDALEQPKGVLSFTLSTCPERLEGSSKGFTLSNVEALSNGHRAGRAPSGAFLFLVIQTLALTLLIVAVGEFTKYFEGD